MFNFWGGFDNLCRRVGGFSVLKINLCKWIWILMVLFYNKCYLICCYFFLCDGKKLNFYDYNFKCFFIK